MSINALSGKVFLVVTGASKGIGRQIAISFASELETDSYILLMARDEVGLKETASRLPSNVAVDYKSVDLSTAKENEIQDILNASLEKKKEMKFSRLVVIHNAGSIGDVSQRTNDMTNLDVWRKYFDLNVFSPAILNGVLMKLFDVKTDKVVINITSLLALKPTKSVGYYCAGKAAREMFFKVFALENPQIDVLNYSPGPVETDMYQEICERATDTDVKEQFTTLRSNQSVLTTEQTVKQLLNVLKQHKYKSGDRVDYFDKL